MDAPNRTAISTVAPDSDPHSEHKPLTKDEGDLAHFGKRQQLRVRLLVPPSHPTEASVNMRLQRNFRLISIFGMTVILVCCSPPSAASPSLVVANKAG